MPKPQEPPELRLTASEHGRLTIVLRGAWTQHATLPSLRPLAQALGDEPPIRQLGFDSVALTAWDSLLALAVVDIQALARAHRVVVLDEGLPPGLRRLLALRSAAADAPAPRLRTPGLLARLGNAALEAWRTALALLAFTGELVHASGRLLRGRAGFRAGDLWLFIQEAGLEALPIVSLISVLVGMILAFVGAFQLQLFGAQVYVANLVGIGITREMGAIMAAIIMAGRTGAAYAAQLGAMQANEEIDALRTLGLSPMEFLVLPRLLALLLMLPLLVAYADLLGMLGGLLVAVSLFDISHLQYLEQTRTAVAPTDIVIGLLKGLVFAWVVAVSGCFQGLSSGRSSQAVGAATTRAVVMAIVGIVVVDSVITLLTTLLRI